MTFSPTLTRESASQPGVTFTVRRMGFGRRTDLDFETLKFRQRLRELEMEYPPQSPAEKTAAEALAIANRKAAQVPAAEFDQVMETDVAPLNAELLKLASLETRQKRAVLDEEYIVIDARIRAATIRAGLVSITGGEVDGMSAEQLLEYGPPALASEIYTVIDDDRGVKGAAAKNSPSPTTSGAAAGGEIENSTAPTVEAVQAGGG